MYRHLIAVKVGVESRADQRVNLDRFAFHQHRLESLYAEAVESRCAIQRHRMLANDFLEDVPADRLLPLDHLTRLFDRGGMALLFKLVVDEWLEQLQSHFLWQTALVQLQLRTDNDHRAARVIDAFAQKVLTKTSLFAFQGSGKRLQRTIVDATQNATATAVVEQRIDRFLKHPFFVAHDYFRRPQLHQLLQTVVAIDNAAIKIVKI